MKTILPWCVASIAIMFAIAGFNKSAKEVIKQVPLEVVKSVERNPTQDELMAIQLSREINAATKISKQSELLRGINKVVLYVQLGPEISNKWSEVTIRDKVTLELRRSGVEVLDSSNASNSQANVYLDVEAMSGSTESTTIYKARLSLYFQITALTWDLKYHSWYSEVWYASTIGYFGSQKTAEAQRNVIEYLTNRLASDYLEANPIKHN